MARLFFQRSESLRAFVRFPKRLFSKEAIYEGVVMSLRHTTDNENRLLARAVLESGSRLVIRSKFRWCCEPEKESDLGTLGKHRLLLRAR